MPDVWSAVEDLDAETQQRLAQVLETRGEDPQQQAMRREFLGEIPFPANARVLEVGCGTGVLTRQIAGWEGVASVVGVDPAPSLVAKAEELAAGIANSSFEEGDGRSLQFADQTFDAVVFDSTLCHVPGPQEALAEAFRVLRPGGILAAFDGDYATTTVAIGDNDPLQACVDAMMAASVNDRWLVRHLRTLVTGCGFDVLAFRGYSFAENTGTSYMFSVVERGLDILLSGGQLSQAAADALRREAQDRAQRGAFFGHIAYGSIIARKP